MQEWWKREWHNLWWPNWRTQEVLSNEYNLVYYEIFRALDWQMLIDDYSGTSTREATAKNYVLGPTSWQGRQIPRLDPPWRWSCRGSDGADARSHATSFPLTSRIVPEFLAISTSVYLIGHFVVETATSQTQCSLATSCNSFTASSCAVPSDIKKVFKISQLGWAASCRKDMRSSSLELFGQVISDPTLTTASD